ncbi:HlyD family type I secretion periplasmic adaptor subunit [Candidatus Symbiobacter mobilis]|uniref:Membrane fusion protein (MFP) family protein n=1 Tax=Candidatus Symbiobacter mobilis CR TaxID=946483 RepID=U5N6V6_9BURK|nr:HlyD family type I secretion periplasmic adaptor subunit [Candidatus Symbiobacter mobilis]AGX87271.1 membrane protein [Candidatus Symbiobacter mobilis CR]
MASTNQPPVDDTAPGASAKPALEFLPDADEIERRPLPLGAQAMMYLVLTVLVLFFTWAAVSDVDLIVTARGKLVTPLPNIVVQPLETSIVQSIDVRVGQVVRKGDRLAALDATFTMADESQLRSRLESLDTQWASLDAALAGERVQANQAKASSDRQIQSKLSDERLNSHLSQLRRQTEMVAKLRSSLETARQDEVVLRQRVKVLREMLTLVENLVAKKLAVKSRLLDARDRLLEAERNMELARNKQIELGRELSVAEADKTAYQTGWRQKVLEDLLAVSRERDSIRDQLQKASRRQSMIVLTAPADAIVLDIAKLSPGSIVREAETFFTLVPIGEVLEAEVEVDAGQIGYVKVGSKVHVKVDAFPFQKHGMLEGTLRTLSQDAFRRDLGGAVGASAYYGARVAMPNLHLDDLPRHAKLLPGMTLTAEIRVGKRSVMSYLLWPLTKAAKESIREP